MGWRDSGHVVSVRGPCRGVICTFSATTQLREVGWRVEVSHGQFAEVSL
jgi:hypothetical protein